MAALIAGIVTSFQTISAAMAVANIGSGTKTTTGLAQAVPGPAEATAGGTTVARASGGTTATTTTTAPALGDLALGDLEKTAVDPAAVAAVMAAGAKRSGGRTVTKTRTGLAQVDLAQVGLEPVDPALAALVQAAQVQAALAEQDRVVLLVGQETQAAVATLAAMAKPPSALKLAAMATQVSPSK